jgi:cysteine synthase B
MIAQLLNIEIELVLPEDSTKERTKPCVHEWVQRLTSAKEGIQGSRDYATKGSIRRLYYVEPVYNEDNWKAHYKTTGPEIE